MYIKDLTDCMITEVEEKFLDRVVNGISVNTEKAVENNDSSTLFVCINGTKHDTHKDIPKLIDNGIKNIVAEYIPDNTEIPEDVNIILSLDTRKTLALASKHYYGSPDEGLTIIGITGTKGKTTVTYMIESVLHRCGINCGIIGTNGIIFNGKTYECENSTPGAYEYYKYLAEMRDEGITHVICEVTSQSLKQHRTFGTVFDIAAFTNLYPDHIGKDEHADFEEYRICKGLLFEHCRKAVINADDSENKYFADKCRSYDVDFSRFSLVDKTAEYYCKSPKTKNTYSKFKCNGKRIIIPLPGNFNIHNAMCAIAILRELNISYDDIIKGISEVKVPGRCEAVPNPAGINIIIDYAHSGESLESILTALKTNKHGKLYCLFGAGGDRSKLRRSGMGQAASEYADYSIITSDNPRWEDPEEIINDILTGIPDKYKSYTVIPDREKAIRYSLSLAKKGDTVLLAGKGAQSYHEICGVKYPFDERKIVSQYYKEMLIQR